MKKIAYLFLTVFLFTLCACTTGKKTTKNIDRKATEPHVNGLVINISTEDETLEKTDGKYILSSDKTYSLTLTETSVGKTISCKEDVIKKFYDKDLIEITKIDENNPLDHQYTIKCLAKEMDISITFVMVNTDISTSTSLYFE